ncbi:MAG: hypothetical protein MK214_16220 [Thalassotalea sp.]|nr:hypothetical protein [Thalassotalea sp.]
MKRAKYLYLEKEIQSALKICLLFKYLKIVLALVLISCYFYFPEWLLELLTLSVVISLTIPLSFFDSFIQKLLEYNTQTIEDRILLNVNEANEHFEKLYKKTN